METENQKVTERYQELLSQNERLHGQAEQLTTQLKVLQRQSQGEDDAVSIASGFSSAEKTAEELWDIIRYSVRACMHASTLIYVYVCTYVCTYVCMYVCMYVHVWCLATHGS